MARAGGSDPLAPLREGEPGPLYFLYGKERYLLDRAVDLLRARVLDPRTKDFNYELFYGKDAGAARIAQAARTLPMMARRRLILVRDADEMKADELAGLSSYVSDPAPETCMVFVAEKADQRLKFFSAFKKHGTLVKLDPLYERQLPDFVRGEARARGVTIAPDAVTMMVDEIGAELGQLADAVERLAIFIGDRKEVSAEDVEKVVATTRQRSVFELANAVGAGDRARALAVLSSMLGARESGVRIVAMLARHLRQLWITSELLQRTRDKFEIAGALGIPPFFADDIIKQARTLDPARAKRMHAALYLADKNLKSSRLDDARTLETLILELTRDTARGASARGGDTPRSPRAP
ncbi:MAG TPA: DNA polymerase III subunit delta [Polyangia bacterium]|jgi:DNA polymerase-3 subunit delta